MKLKISDWLEKGKKNKFLLKEIGVKRLVIILLVGVLLIIISVPNERESKNITKNNKEIHTLSEVKKGTGEKYKESLEKNLKEIIEQVDGIDRAEVMITLKSSKEEIILKDEPYEKEESDKEKVHSNEEKTVIIEDEKGNTYPYVIKEINPEIEGIVAIIRTKDINKEEEIIELIQVLFDVPVHKIKIMKMKNK